MIAVGSIVRDGMGYLERTIRQLEALDRLVRLRWILVEGDSIDGTKGFLSSAGFPFQASISTFDHHGPCYPSVDHPDRWWRISLTCNRVLARVLPSDEAFVWVEADLIWEAETVVGLLADLDDVPVVAPLSVYRDGRFHDTWGYRKDGLNFSAEPPYHPAVGSGLTELDSCGSCLVMRTEVALRTRFDEQPAGNLGIVGWCRNIRAAGFRIYLDPRYRVYHDKPDLGGCYS